MTMLRILLQRFFGTENPLHAKLRNVPLFKELSHRELREIEQALQRNTLAAGETIFEQGDAGVGLYIILSGEVEISQESEDGSTVQLTHIEDDAFFGETALLDDASRTATAVAVEETELALFPRSGLLALAEQRPHLGVKIVMQLSQIIAERLRRTNRGLRAAREEVEAIQKRFESDSK